MEFHTATRANSLSALVLRAANNDFSGQNFYQTYRPSLVFYHDPQFVAEQRVLIARDYPGEDFVFDERVCFELYLPCPAHLTLPATTTPSSLEAPSTLQTEIVNVDTSSESQEPLDAPVVDICLEELDHKK
ncbi:hypothetical protein CYLTODRAFT_439809 [Cylindrobasidium torrendii FP15055 ss-10]|uniref:Uncharacterized protein n=1 Tax=Cylindrobasidium torrendii FP15055 ss-10 TaxID=1314674 RepID=A0A0D7BV89_9AGAR|nr:hypothetical protein CYLTODRAFT_439809 [Cylindrobasidium torrendii FP15055 ss-10]